MADKTHATGAAGKAPTADQPDKVRNVVLVGHSGAGKTTLVAALLKAESAVKLSVSYTTRSPREGEQDRGEGREIRPGGGRAG